MTTNKNDTLSLSDVEKILDMQVASGGVLASCPMCDQYLSYQEYKILKCTLCDKKIEFKDIMYFTGAKKDNN